ncbi:hypothetical protein LXL04_001755 [Taraxacum kok-saghyz]
MVVLIDSRVRQRQLCVFMEAAVVIPKLDSSGETNKFEKCEAQFVDSLSKGLQVGDCWDVKTIERTRLKLYHKVPDYNFLKTFGCLCYPFLRPYNKHKLDFRSLPHVVFNEDIFPYTTPQPLNTPSPTSSPPLSPNILAHTDTLRNSNSSLPSFPAPSPPPIFETTPVTPISPQSPGGTSQSTPTSHSSSPRYRHSTISSRAKQINQFLNCSYGIRAHFTIK